MLDVTYEDRKYADIQLQRRATIINPKPQSANVKRSDYGPVFGIDLTKEFTFDSRLISIFQSFTPEISLLSTNYASTVKQFAYKDFTATLSFEFGF